MMSDFAKISTDQVYADIIGSAVNVVVDDYQPSKSVENFNNLSEIFIFEDYMDVYTESGRHYQVWVAEDEESVFGYGKHIGLICLRENDEDVQIFGFGMEIINWEYRNLYVPDEKIVELAEKKVTNTVYTIA